ncbi:D-alanyl-D-alanine carboxypeptidase/D-alanyl-D-alanine endopeptidase [Nonomuraea endophytica]|uniref:D-alanyl-D-alanine carboxypeptidase/D-alanyl-D-alanine-endopeptidase (Penicillin-binding protein 4) n=1 Tax=Nonomuraea endophytica TaxID=714136 RepID=A0A7W8ELV9_9ACTN|nr:D-alanyl-D-alanine carboxypeptidase/D-alanyl-D-alanine-endopeptidase [Nonomuraea endophytica]MBB5084056.1 D-alanyl-D-alanine carboxypeptidase/D-alanyl-D-alanine-endopeptidase (penicillin-binding protein 4) [Nonomuraea endophytica]
MTGNHSRRSVLKLFGAVPVAAAGLPAIAPVRADRSLAARIAEITKRPEFTGSHWGMRFQLAGAGPVYSLNPEQRFVAGSAFKVFIAGSAFAALGADRRFRTTVHGTGPVVHGVLKGDLVLVADGDLLLGPRIRPHGKLALPVPDHSYGSATALVPGDPLQQVRHLARQVARRGIRRVEGRVIVDASLFRQGSERIANGNISIPVSPMMINDNIIDVVVTPGGHAGAPARLRVSPNPAYLTVLNEVTTVLNPVRRLTFTEVPTAAGRTRTVRLTGDVRPGGQPVVAPYYVPDPVRFAEIAFGAALREAGVRVTDGRAASGKGRREPLAEHVSPPLSEQVKVMLKVSSNPHTAHFPYLVGATAGRDPDTPKATGERLQRELFRRFGLDPDDPVDERYTSDFFVQFLSHMARRRDFTAYRQAMPIMGRDGSIAHVLPGSPAAGRVFAKTGTASQGKVLNKALAGYVVLPDDRLVVFAQFMNTPVGSLDEAMELQRVVEIAQGEIATAVYESLTR